MLYNKTMEPGQLVVGFVFLVLGGTYVVSPEKIFNFQKAVSKKVYGVTLKPSARTFKTYKLIGIIFFIMGLIVLTGKFGS